MSDLETPARQSGAANALRGLPDPDGALTIGRSSPPSLRLDLPMAVAARTTLVIMGLVLVTYLLWRIQEVIFLLFVAILLATSIEPLVNRLRRGPFTRGSGVLVVYTGILLLIAIPIYLVVPSLIAEGGRFVETLPQQLGTLRPQVLAIQPRVIGDALAGAVDQAAASLRTPASPAGDQLVAAGTTAAQTAINFLTVFILALYWLLERATIKRLLMQVVGPTRARGLNTVWLEVEVKLGGWVRGQLLLMLAIGVMAGIGYTVIGLPNPLLLGVVAGLAEAIPMVGPFLAFAPAVLVALATDPSRALVVAGYALVIQQLESQVLLPRVMGHAVGVSPLTVLLGILIGSALYGLPGAFLAVPVAGAVQVILAHLLHSEDQAQAEAHTTPAGREHAQAGPGA